MHQISKIYFVIKLYMFRASAVPIIRSYLLYTRQLVVGRPKLRWKNGVNQDMRILGAKNWKKVALNRDEWAKLLKKVRGHQGLSSQ